jgi:hypothetical protein
VKNMNIVELMEKYLLNQLKLSQVVVIVVLIISIRLLEWFLKLAWEKWCDSRKPNSVDIDLWKEFRLINHTMLSLAKTDASDELDEVNWRIISSFVDGNLCGTSKQKSFISERMNKLKNNFCVKAENFATEFAKNCQHNGAYYKIRGTRGVDEDILKLIKELQSSMLKAHEEFYKEARDKLENRKV